MAKGKKERKKKAAAKHEEQTKKKLKSKQKRKQKDKRTDQSQAKVKKAAARKHQRVHDSVDLFDTEFTFEFTAEGPLWLAADRALARFDLTVDEAFKLFLTELASGNWLPPQAEPVRQTFEKIKDKTKELLADTLPPQPAAPLPPLPEDASDQDLIDQIGKLLSQQDDNALAAELDQLLAQDEAANKVRKVVVVKNLEDILKFFGDLKDGRD